MHPIEASGFGLGMAAALVVLPISVPAIILFATLNVVAGTLAHLPATPETRRYFWSEFHQTHHDHPDTNHGFFLPFWDRVAGTRRARSAQPVAR